MSHSFSILRPDRPLPVVDPRTNKKYVLLDADKFEQLRNLLDPGPLTKEEREAIVRGVWTRAGWDDPKMDDYEALQVNACLKAALPLP